MESFKDILIEDLDVYKNALEIKDIQFCNIISNRITMNAVFLESKEFALIGAILKDTLPNFQKLEEDYEQKARKEFMKVIDNYLKYIETIDCFTILDKYSEYYDIFRQHFNSSIEKYTENKEYTSYVIKFCLEFLKKELEENILPYSEDIVTSGILNEILRTSQNFGCTSHQHMLKLILSFFSRLNDYFKVVLLSDELTESKRLLWRERFNVFRNKLKRNISLYELSDTYIEKSLEDLYCFIKEWRLMFIRLMNLLPSIRQQQVKIPSRIENELKKMVSETISKELKGEE